MRAPKSFVLRGAYLDAGVGVTGHSGGPEELGSKEAIARFKGITDWSCIVFQASCENHHLCKSIDDSAGHPHGKA